MLCQICVSVQSKDISNASSRCSCLFPFLASHDWLSFTRKHVLFVECAHMHFKASCLRRHLGVGKGDLVAGLWAEMNRGSLAAIGLLGWLPEGAVLAVVLNASEWLPSEVARGFNRLADVVHLPGDSRLSSSHLRYLKVCFTHIIRIVSKGLCHFFLGLLNELILLLYTLGFESSRMSCECNIVFR